MACAPDSIFELVMGVLIPSFTRLRCDEILFLDRHEGSDATWEYWGQLRVLGRREVLVFAPLEELSGVACPCSSHTLPLAEWELCDRLENE